MSFTVLPGIEFKAALFIICEKEKKNFFLLKIIQSHTMNNCKTLQIHHKM